MSHFLALFQQGVLQQHDIPRSQHIGMRQLSVHLWVDGLYCKKTILGCATKNTFFWG